jgi:hypothetical protein
LAASAVTKEFPIAATIVPKLQSFQKPLRLIIFGRFQEKQKKVESVFIRPVKKDIFKHLRN